MKKWRVSIVEAQIFINFQNKKYEVNSQSTKNVNKCFINVSKKTSVSTVKVIRINDTNKNKL